MRLPFLQNQTALCATPAIMVRHEQEQYRYKERDKIQTDVNTAMVNKDEECKFSPSD